MSLYLKIILVLFGLAYLISPVDIIPDLLLPYIGWLDDGLLIAILVYLFRTGKLPDFIFKRPGKAKSKYQQESSRHQQQSYSKKDNRKTADNEKEKNQDKKKTPYEILGVRPGATKKEIQTAYKEAIKKYHPDKLSHLGEEFSNLANEKFLEIQDAYEALMKYY